MGKNPPSQSLPGLPGIWHFQTMRFTPLHSSLEMRDEKQTCVVLAATQSEPFPQKSGEPYPSAACSGLAWKPKGLSFLQAFRSSVSLAFATPPDMLSPERSAEIRTTDKTLSGRKFLQNLAKHLCTARTKAKHGASMGAALGRVPRHSCERHSAIDIHHDILCDSCCEQIAKVKHPPQQDPSSLAADSQRLRDAQNLSLVSSECTRQASSAVSYRLVRFGLLIHS